MASDPIVHNTHHPVAALKMRLCVMMFIQYFVQGCYLPIISLYLKDTLKFSSSEIGYFGSALAVGPLFAPFLIGQLVDRKVATDRVLAFCHLSGGITMLFLYQQTAIWPILILGVLYSLLYVPSMMLTNSLTFYHLRDDERERFFPWIRLFGTLGFIVPAWLIELVFLKGLTGDELDSGRGVALMAAGIAGLVMGVYSLLLPHTPPIPDLDRKFAPGLAVRLVRQQRFLILISVSIIVAVVHKFFFVVNSPYLKYMLGESGIEGAWEQRLSSLGQIAEIAVMATLGWMIKRVGFKRTMLLGISAYTLRCVIFALAPALSASPWLAMTLVCVGQLMHGLCFGCFLATAFIYIDATAPADIRGSVQNLYGTFVLGVGFFIGGFVSGWISNAFETTVDGITETNWKAIWLISAGIALAGWLLFAWQFPRSRSETGEATSDDSASRPD
ncbi:MAG: MFS transporter [Planctomycetaceae bacterium]